MAGPDSETPNISLRILSDPVPWGDELDGAVLEFELAWPPSVLAEQLLTAALATADDAARDDLDNAIALCHGLQDAIEKKDAEEAAILGIALAHGLARVEIRGKHPDIELGKKHRLSSSKGGSNSRVLNTPEKVARALATIREYKKPGVSLTDACGQASVALGDVSDRTLLREWKRHN